MKLVDEIKHLKDVNEEKESQLENISKENKLLKVELDRLEAIESENVILNDKLDKNDDVDKNDEQIDFFVVGWMEDPPPFEPEQGYL